jgi:hypothetical protein
MALPNPNGESPQLNTPETSGPGADLVEWIMSRVKHGRDVRDRKYAKRWKEYTRLWRGFWSEEDRGPASERSKLIAPALQQAVEMTVAEMDEAAFSKFAWFDVTEDLEGEEKDQATYMRDLLLEDFAADRVPSAASQIFLLGAVYGTGIGKINVTRKPEKEFVDGKVIERQRVGVDLVPIRPDEFVIDPSALTVDDAEYCAHEMVRPIHGVIAKQKQGIYKNTMVTPYAGVKSDTDGTGTKANVEVADRGVLITEYFGKVPASMIPGSTEKGLVEAIVTVANENTLLRAVESPFLMKDRPIVAYQHDTVPGEFWGRGVCEKGYNPQKALDAELRARIDALALLSSPMMGADLTRLPRNFDASVRPGRTIFTRGRPSEILEPVAFGDPAILGGSFQHTGDLERMVQMGTGAMDSATPVGVNARNETASGMSQLQAGFIKRSKRTMGNVEHNFLQPLIRKSLWRYMQFDPRRYPQDTKFRVVGTMGIMAKEVENAQLINMLGFLQPDEPARGIVIQAIFENSASANKRELMEAMEQQNAPPSEEEQQMQQQMQEAQMQMIMEQLREQVAKADKLEAEVEKIRAETEHIGIKADLEDDKVEIQAAAVSVGAEKARVASQQVRVAAQRNEIEATKARSKSSS